MSSDSEALANLKALLTTLAGLYSDVVADWDTSTTQQKATAIESTCGQMEYCKVHLKAIASRENFTP